MKRRKVSVKLEAMNGFPKEHERGWGVHVSVDVPGSREEEAKELVHGFAKELMELQVFDGGGEE